MSESCWQTRGSLVLPNIRATLDGPDVVASLYSAFGTGTEIPDEAIDILVPLGARLGAILGS